MRTYLPRRHPLTQVVIDLLAIVAWFAVVIGVPLAAIAIFFEAIN